MNNKGISPLVATLYLIGIAIAASIITYSWVLSMIAEGIIVEENHVEEIEFTITFSDDDETAILWLLGRDNEKDLKIVANGISYLISKGYVYQGYFEVQAGTHVSARARYIFFRRI